MAHNTRPFQLSVCVVLFVAVLLTHGKATAHGLEESTKRWHEIQRGTVADQKKSTLLQRLREMLGLVRPIAVGGSRASGPRSFEVARWSRLDLDRSVMALSQPLLHENEACLLSPWIGGTGNSEQGHRVAITPSGAPPIVSSTPLLEVQILKGNTMLWRGMPSSNERVLANPLEWPIAPLQPGESMLLKFRNSYKKGLPFFRVELRRPLDAVPLRNSASIAPLSTLRTLLQQNRQADVVELLFREDLKGNPQLQNLARTARRNGCLDHPSARMGK